MKRILALSLILLLSVFTAQGALAKTGLDREFIFMLSGDAPVETAAPAELINGVVFAPFSVFTALGARIEWKSDLRAMLMTFGGKSLYFEEPSKTVYTDADSAAFALYMQGDYLMIPAEFTARYFGFSISYVPGYQMFRIHLPVERLSDLEVFARYKERCEQENARYINTLLSTIKRVYLTFDDGPSERTGQILDLLKKYDMKATFFMLAGRIYAYPDAVKRIHNEGSALGLHGVSHRLGAFYDGKFSPVLEMNGANDALYGVLGAVTRLVRVPYGSRPHLTKEQYKTLLDYGYLMWDWNIDSKDSAQSPTVRSIEKTVKSSVGKFSCPVVLFHEKTVTVSALENILIHLRQNGYTALPLSEDLEPYNWQR